MIFYEIEAKKALDPETVPPRKRDRALASVFSSKSEAFYHKTGEKCFIFPFSEQSDRIAFGAILTQELDAKALFQKFSKTLPVELADASFEEITFHSLSSRLSIAERSDYLSEKNDVLEWFRLDALEQFNYDFKFGENLISEEFSAEHCLDVAGKHLFRESFAPELERILTPPTKKGMAGHPVHYMVRTDHRESRKEVCRALLSSLYAAGRIRNKRYAFWDFREDERLFPEPLSALYTSCMGGAVIIRLTGNFSREGRYASRSRDNVEKIIAMADSFKNRVLTVFCMKKNCECIKDLILTKWNGTPLIELYEGVVGKEEALVYLKSKAKEEKIRTDKALAAALDKAGPSFSMTELDGIFSRWYDQKLRRSIYPQYRSCKSTKMEIREEKARGTAYEKLQNLIGLGQAKALMEKAIAYFKAQKLFADRGFATEKPSMHMIFTGNPGTAKTTVARLFASIMKENGLLPSGTLYEVGRGDLVGRYVGSTAPLVKEAFLRAKGGVLFIDEAYSLVDDRDGLFGDEAINTITQEMENNRQDTVVIFAGYPDKMEGFLKKNPGLRSRIAFHLPFEDYSASELCGITDLIAAESGLVLEENAREKLSSIFERARVNSDFGNGRFARNLVEKAKMAQAQRLMKLDPDSISDRDLQTLCAEDFEAPEQKREERSLPIGFSA